ncbi:MAG: hypothetical protein RJA36_1853 [Pseudomonadota bacterium]|jgi:hypothetical protein
MNRDIFDRAMAAHLAHGAMAGADPLTESYYALLDEAAAEGAQAPSSHGAGLTPEQRAALDDEGDSPWLYLAMGAAAVAVCLISALVPWGAA